MIRVACALLLVGLDLGELGVHHLLVRLTAAARLRTGLRPALSAGAGAGLRALRLRVHHLAELLRGLGELLGLAFELLLGRVLLLEKLFRALQSRFDLPLLVRAD